MVPSYSIVQSAINEAKRSRYHTFKMGAVVFKGDRILSVGKNDGCRSFSKLRPEEFRFTRWHTSIHAEMDAICNSKITELRRAKLLVVRINSHGELRLAKPCLHCYQFIKYAGVRQIYYSIPIHPYIEELV